MTLAKIRIVPVPAPPKGDEVEQALYEVRKKIYPRAVSGIFARWRWTIMLITQVVFYGLPWVTWNGRQAVLFDLAARKFYLFGAVLWPQDVIYLTVLLVLSALSLFLFTAVAGRLWCGYSCPQTVYTEIFLWIERKIEGERLARIRLDAAAMSLEKFVIKALKHTAWGTLALWTGFTFVGYFTPIKTLGMEFFTATLGPWQTFWILFYAFATYGNAGWMREQVCKYMCPYARFQSVMFDRDTLVITYDAERGEPRGSRNKKSDARTLGLGDCVDCGICVQVCPTGIDIRNGLQYECIGCAACIDGCDQVMDRMGYPKGLIRYDTSAGLEQHLTFRQKARRVLRPRTLFYAGLLLAIAAALVTSLALRKTLKVDVLRDRASLAREAAPGIIENVYRLQIMNTGETPHSYRIGVTGLPGAAVVGVDGPVAVPGATTQSVPLRVRVAESAGQPGVNKIEFTVDAVDDPQLAVVEKSTFIIPR
ncbi:MAG: cytochrome c oxidase accessory protein CcoG [Burkholderiales bacterium]|nr:cytochrome c oxidase accessory protein CcoG [Burkholderiales bacterium]